MTLNTLTLLIAVSTLSSVFYYWATANLKWLKIAYSAATLNGIILIYVNWVLSGPNRVIELVWFPEFAMEFTTNTSGTNLFSILCVWMIFSGIRGLMRLRKERKGHETKNPR